MEKIKIKSLIVMGVSGCGKSTIAEKLAEVYGYAYIDGDEFHPQKNIEKMRNGIPLNDHDRKGWLQKLNAVLKAHSDGAVLACSALKPAYREALTHGLPNTVFVYLKGDFDTIWKRHQLRKNHYFNGEDMLKNQFNSLIEPEGDFVATVSVDGVVEDIVEIALCKLNTISCTIN